MPMDYCKRCKKLFQVTTDKICDECKEKEKEEFDIVKDFIRDNPNKTVIEISYSTGIDEEVILSFLRKGRLQNSGYTLTYPCENCQAPITSGTLCPKCQGNIESTMSKLKDEIKQDIEKDENKVNFSIRDKRSLARKEEIKFKVVKTVGPDGKIKIEKVPIE
jgi:flagellar operon protein (TIGR03826 family)